MQNSITIIGRLGADPEVGETETGSKYARFSVAVSRDYKDADGNQITDWFQVTAWNRLAESVAKYAKKGRLVSVTGPQYFSKGKSDKYFDEEGNPAPITYSNIPADRVYYLDSQTTTRDQGPLMEEPRKGSNIKTVEGKGAGVKPPKSPSKKQDAVDPNDLPFNQ